MIFYKSNFDLDKEYNMTLLMQDVEYYFLPMACLSVKIKIYLPVEPFITDIAANHGFYSIILPFTGKSKSFLQFHPDIEKNL